METTAFSNGYSDGQDAAHEQGANAETIRSWFAPGSVLPDESLINALQSDRLAAWLGISIEQLNERGAAFSTACEEYNAGFREGANGARLP